MAGIRIPLQSSVIPFVSFGIVPGFLVRAIAEVTIDGSTNTDNSKEHFEFFDLSLTLGTGSDIPTDYGTFRFEIRWTPGLIPVDTKDSSAEKVMDWKNNTVSFSVGYLFVR